MMLDLGLITEVTTATTAALSRYLYHVCLNRCTCMCLRRELLLLPPLLLLLLLR